MMPEKDMLMLGPAADMRFTVFAWSVRGIEASKDGDEEATAQPTMVLERVAVDPGNITAMMGEGNDSEAVPCSRWR